MEAEDSRNIPSKPDKKPEKGVYINVGKNEDSKEEEPSKSTNEQSYDADYNPYLYDISGPKKKNMDQDTYLD